MHQRCSANKMARLISLRGVQLNWPQAVEGRHPRGRYTTYFATCKPPPASEWRALKRRCRVHESMAPTFGEEVHPNLSRRFGLAGIVSDLKRG